MAAAGVPVVPASDGAVLPRARGRPGSFPVLLKAVGGGGRGMRLVESEEARAFASASAEALAARRRRPLSRAGDRPGAPRGGSGAGRRRRRVLMLGEREYSSAPPPEADRRVPVAASHRTPRRWRPRHARSGRSATATRTLIPARPGRQLLLHRAERSPAGRTSRQRACDRNGSRARTAASRAGSCAARGEPSAGARSGIRINVEDPARGFLPAPFAVERWGPLGLASRVDTYVEAGAVVPPYYDQLLAKVLAWDDDARRRSRGRSARCPSSRCRIPTTREWSMEALRSEEFASGRYSTAS